MNEIKWIKIDLTLFDNRKIKVIRSMPEGDSLVVVWLQLLCLAGKANDFGKVYVTETIPYTDQLLANECGEPLSTIQLALTTFQNLGMIEVENDIIYISNWEKYQAIEQMELIKQQNRERQKKWYDTHKKVGVKKPNVMLTDNLTQPNGTDIDIDIRDKNKNSNNSKATKRFTPPSKQDVSDYCRANGYDIDVDMFYAYYAEGNWHDSKGNPVKNWKQKVITWSKKNQKPKQENKVPDFTINKKERGISKEDEELLKRVFGNER